MDAVELLTTGTIEVQGRMPWSSNATFLVTVTAPDSSECTQAIYKPLKGERPLWDFPSGLYQREVAAYRLSEAMGFGVIPPTVVVDGPFGDGSLQLFIEADFEQHYFTLYEHRPDLHDQFRTMAAFDVIANNTDRKAGHVLIDADSHIWGIDQGLCFSAEPKLRTVIWEFSGEDLPDEVRASVSRVADQVPLDVATLLLDDEVEMIQVRAQRLLDRGRFPINRSNHGYPWPLV
jgi:uncharacterized repeat protein (TIGR03843 family)